jgi:hypothetical protein
MQPHDVPADIFLHIRVVVGIVLGLGITRLLTGVAAFVQHPGRQKLYWVHLAWVLSILLTLVHFWWWEFWLVGLDHWNFGVYIFVIAFAILLFLLCALLFPTDIAEYSGYDDYFLSRRRWFFGVFAATIIFDLVDTLLKGQVHFAMFAGEYAIRVPAYLLLCIIAMITPDRRFHGAFVVVSLIYQVSWILRLFYTLY